MNLFLSRLGLDSHIAPNPNPSGQVSSEDSLSLAQEWPSPEFSQRFCEAMVQLLANRQLTGQETKLDRAKAIAAEVRERRGWKVQRAVHD